MHIYWFILIYQMTKKMVVDSTFEGDIRSEPEFTPLTYEEPVITSESALTPQTSDHSFTGTSQYSDIHKRKKAY